MNLWPQSLKTYKKNSMFIKVLLFFTLLSVICTLVVGYGTYIVSSRLLVEEVGNANFRLLQQAKEAVDKEITMLNKISLQVAADRRVNKALFVEVRNSATDIQLSQEIIVYLNSLKLTYSDWATLWLYFDKSQTVLSHEGRFSADFFFKEFSYRRSGVDWGKILNSYAAFHSVGRETIGGGSGAVPVITLIRSMPLFEYLPLGMIVFDVKERLFGNIINTVSGKTPVVTYVLDRQGNVLFCNEKERNPNDAPFLQEALRKNLSLFSGAGSMQRGIKGRKYTISYISSSVTDWQYVSFIPTRYITQKVSYVGYLTLIVVIACLLIGLVLSYCLTRKIYHRFTTSSVRFRRFRSRPPVPNRPQPEMS
jgi:two-component system response regulator YesN